MKTVLIMAAGPYKYGWTKKRPKELALINKQPLILRTLEQLAKRGLDNAIVVTRNERVKNAAPNYFEPKDNYWWTQTLLSTRELWSDWTAIVNGDCIYSKSAMDMLAAEHGPVKFIGDKVHKEILVFTAEANSRVIAAAESANKSAYRRQSEPLTKRFKKSYDQGRHTMHYAFYRALAGLPLVNLEKRVYSPEIHLLLPERDYTCDIDKVDSYRKFLSKHAWARKVK